MTSHLFNACTHGIIKNMQCVFGKIVCNVCVCVLLNNSVNTQMYII